MRELAALTLSAPVAAAMARACTTASSQEEMAEVAIVAAVEHNRPNDLLQVIGAGLAKIADYPDLIFLACEHGNVDVLRLLIEHGGSPSEPLSDTSTPLLVASTHKHTECVELLLSKHANANAACKDGMTPLLAACEVNAVAVVKALLEGRAEPNQVRDSGSTPLYTAACHGHDAIVELLLRHGAMPDAPNVGMHYQGVTPLYAACLHGHAQIVRSLVKQRCDARAQLPNGQSPLQAAISRRHHHAAMAVLEAPLGDVEDLDSTEARMSAAIGAPSSSLSVSSAAMRLRSAIDGNNLEQLCEAINAVATESDVPSELLKSARQVRDALRTKARKSARKSRLKAEAARQRQSSSSHANAERQGTAYDTDTFTPLLELAPIEVEAVEVISTQPAASSAAGLDDSGIEEVLTPSFLDIPHVTSVGMVYGAPMENADTDEQRQCVVCLDAPRSHLFVPCGHRCVCGPCAEAVLSDGTSECPMCRSRSTQTLRVFM